MVARVSLDVLKARKSRLEEPLDRCEGALDVRVPDPIVSRIGSCDPEQEALLADSSGLAAACAARRGEARMPEVDLASQREAVKAFIAPPARATSRRSRRCSIPPWYSGPTPVPCLLEESTFAAASQGTNTVREGAEGCGSLPTGAP
jgi:hypothetical protein